jgi:hypothetical protein
MFRRSSYAAATSQEDHRSKGVKARFFLLGFVFVMTLHTRCVVTSSGPSQRHPAGHWMIRCN